MSQVPLPAVHAGFWPAITRRTAASSVAPVFANTSPPCVLASLGAHDPEPRRYHWKRHSPHRRSRSGEDSSVEIEQLSTGAALRLSGTGALGVVCVNGGQGAEVPGTWSATIEWLV